MKLRDLCASKNSQPTYFSIHLKGFSCCISKNFWSGSMLLGQAAAGPARVVRRCPLPPPHPQHVPFYYGTAVSPHCATRTPEDAPRQLDGGGGEGGSTTCPPDHLGPPVGAPAELLRATSVGRQPPTGQQIPVGEETEPRIQLRFLRAAAIK